MGELQFHNGGTDCSLSNYSLSVMIVFKLRLMEGLRLSSSRFTASSITDSICFSEVILLFAHPKIPSKAPFSSSWSLIFLMEGRDTMESLRLEDDRDEPRSVVLVLLRSSYRRISLILLSTSIF
jgi:hypothetical protein